MRGFTRRRSEGRANCATSGMFWWMRRGPSLIRRPRRKAKLRITLGADKGHDVSPFVAKLRAHKVTPDVMVQSIVSKRGKVRNTSIDR